MWCLFSVCRDFISTSRSRPMSRKKMCNSLLAIVNFQPKPIYLETNLTHLRKTTYRIPETGGGASRLINQILHCQNWATYTHWMIRMIRCWRKDRGSLKVDIESDIQWHARLSCHSDENFHCRFHCVHNRWLETSACQSIPRVSPTKYFLRQSVSLDV